MDLQGEPTGDKDSFVHFRSSIFATLASFCSNPAYLAESRRNCLQKIAKTAKKRVGHMNPDYERVNGWTSKVS